MANDNAEVAAARGALVRAIGAWSDAYVASGVYVGDPKRVDPQAEPKLHVAMLEAIDAYGAACAAAAGRRPS